MKSFLLLFLAILLAQSSYGQWQYNGNNAYLLNGNVGIGTSSPDGKLSIGGYIGNRGLFVYDSGTEATGMSQGNSELRIFGASSGVNHISFGKYDLPSDIFSEQMRIDINGNVGIGTQSPVSRLTVVGSNASLWGISLGYGTNNAIITTDDNTKPITFQIAGTEALRITTDGKVAIGTTDPKGYQLAVNGSAIAISMTVKLNASWPDYVFKPAYHLQSLPELKNYIDENHHLPDMPSEDEVKKEGINLGEMVKLQTKKIEELTLYLIEKDNQLKAQQKEIEQLRNQKEVNVEQQNRITELEKKLNMLIKSLKQK